MTIICSAQPNQPRKAAMGGRPVDCLRQPSLCCYFAFKQRTYTNNHLLVMTRRVNSRNYNPPAKRPAPSNLTQQPSRRRTLARR